VSGYGIAALVLITTAALITFTGWYDRARRNLAARHAREDARDAAAFADVEAWLDYPNYRGER